MTGGLYVTDPAVLVVDDEKEVADAYALRLDDVARVRVAYDGRGALSAVEEATPDVVLLDRHMPGLSGDEVLDRLREREVRTRVVMVTAIDPDLGVLDMPFDDYLCKPVSREDVRATVDQQCRVLAYELLGEYFQTAATWSVVAADPDTDSDPAEDLRERAESLADRVSGLLPESEAEDLLSTFDAVDREGF